MSKDLAPARRSKTHIVQPWVCSSSRLFPQMSCRLCQTCLRLSFQDTPRPNYIPCCWGGCRRAAVRPSLEHIDKGGREMWEHYWYMGDSQHHREEISEVVPKALMHIRKHPEEGYVNHGLVCSRLFVDDSEFGHTSDLA